MHAFPFLHREAGFHSHAQLLRVDCVCVGCVFCIVLYKPASRSYGCQCSSCMRPALSAAGAPGGGEASSDSRTASNCCLSRSPSDIALRRPPCLSRMFKARFASADVCESEARMHLPLHEVAPSLPCPAGIRSSDACRRAIVTRAAVAGCLVMEPVRSLCNTVWREDHS